MPEDQGGVEMMSTTVQEDASFAEEVDRVTGNGVCDECGKKLAWKPGKYTLKPWHCSRKCYSKWLWRYIKKNGLLK